MRRAGALRVAPVVLAIALLVASATSPTAWSDGFHTGDAQASADSLSVNLKAANATIGITYGRALASYQDRTATSEGRAIDLGVLPVLFSGEQCDGTPGILPTAMLPPVSRADSSETGSDKSQRVQVLEPRPGDQPIGGPIGFQDATATQMPSSWATSETVPIELFLLGIDGARTEVSTRREGTLREARAVSTADQLRVLGGLFTFDKPRWEALAQSGSRTTATGSFTFERATVLGSPRSAEEAMSDLAGFKTFLEQLLAPLGIVLELPTVEVREDGVRVTPMGFRIVNPPFGTELITPLLGAIDDQVQQWRAEALAADCKNATLLTVLDVIIGILGGSGAFEALVGGVDAATHDTDYSIPPIPESAVTGDTTATEPIASDVMVDDYSYDAGDLGSYDDLGTLDLSSDMSSDFAQSATAVTPTAAAGTERAVLPAASLNRYEDSSAGRAGVAVGVIALLGALGMALAERLRGRRAMRRIP